MATNDLLQRLPTVGETFTTLNDSNRRQIETFIAADAINQYDAVSFDLANATDAMKVTLVRRGMITADANCCIGIAQKTVAAGERVDVVTCGITEANVEAATVAGDRLYMNTVGQLAVYAAAITLPIVAHACEADTANIATVIFLKQF